jgi:hypothetical protein
MIRIFSFFNPWITHALYISFCVPGLIGDSSVNTYFNNKAFITPSSPGPVNLTSTSLLI